MINYSESSKEPLLVTFSKKKVIIGKNLSFTFFILGMIFFYFDLIRNAYMSQEESLFLPYEIVIIIKLIIIFFLAASAITAFIKGQHKKLKPVYRIWLGFIFIFLILLTFYGVFRQNGIREIIIDFSLFLPLFAGILVGSNKKNWVFFDKFILTLFFINTVMVFKSWFDILQGEIFNPYTTGRIFHSKYYYFMGELGIWPYFLLTIRDGSTLRKTIIYIGIATYFIATLTVAKRSPFVVLILLTCLLFFKNQLNILWKPKKRSSSGNLLRFFIIGILFISILFSLGLQVHFKDIIDKLTGRFTLEGNIAGTLFQDPRIKYDAELTLNRFSDWELLIGQGIGASTGVYDPGLLDLAEVSGKPVEEIAYNVDDYVLHNGMLYMFQKGGLLLVMIWCSGWFYFFKDFLVTKNLFFNRYYIPVSVAFLFSFITGFMDWGNGFAFLMMSAGMGMARKKVLN